MSGVLATPTLVGRGMKEGEEVDICKPDERKNKWCVVWYIRSASLGGWLACLGLFWSFGYFFIIRLFGIKIKHRALATSSTVFVVLLPPLEGGSHSALRERL